MAGSVTNWSSMDCRKRVRSSQPGYFVAGMIMLLTTRRDVSSIPMSMRYAVRKLRSMRPAPVRSTSVSASCATMSPVVMRRARTPPDPERPPSLSSSWMLVVEACSAGASPKRRPVARHVARKTANVRQSIEKTIQ
jgi:hypothetical protein